jgi:hypothetical protein
MGDTDYYEFFKKKFQWETPKGSAQYGRKAGWRPGETHKPPATNPRPLAQLVNAEKGIRKAKRVKTLIKGLKVAGKVGKGLLRGGAIGALAYHNVTFSVPTIAGALYHGAKAGAADSARRAMKNRSERKYGTVEKATATRRKMYEKPNG